MIDVNGMCFQLFLRKLPPVPEMRPKVVNFTQELVADFTGIDGRFGQEYTLRPHYGLNSLVLIL